MGANLMKTLRWTAGSAALAFLPLALLAGCAGVPIPDLDDIINGNDNANDNGGPPPAAVELTDFATSTEGASGLAVRPSDGALFAVNADGLFGPIQEGDDVSTLTPYGATNLGDDDLFDLPPTSSVLAIDSSGEFWIGSQCCITVARVPAEGGNATPFTGLLEGDDAANIFPETLVFVPDSFDGPQIDPGNLLVGEDTTFSKLAAIDVVTGTVTNVENPSELIKREAHHLAFGPDGTLYSSRGVSSATFAGLQTIAEDGTPTPLPGTLRVAAHTFVVLDNGDLLYDGVFRTSAVDVLNGLFFWSAEDEEIVTALELPAAQTSEHDEMIMAEDGTIYLSLPNLNKIVTVTINE
jgi:hypothetical protein